MSGPYNPQPGNQPGGQPQWGGYPGSASYPQQGQPGYAGQEGYQQGGYQQGGYQQAGYQQGAYSYPQQTWGARRRETVGVIGLIGGAVGAALLIVSFTALAWYRIIGRDIKFSDIHKSLKIPQPKASRHLAYLRRSGLVETRREGLWIHYRLGRLADPVMAAIVDAVRHALTHVDSVHRDVERLQKKTGCCVPTPGDVARVACCTPHTATLNVVRHAVTESPQ